MAAIVQVTKAVRFAFVGCGTIARHHLGALKQSSHATAVTAVVDVNRERAESLLRLLPKTQEENSQKCKMFTSLTDALRWGEFDAVIVMVPHHLHEPYATECLQAGKHLLLEKPLAHTVESCQQLLKCTKRREQVFMVGENSAFWPEVRKAQELINSGTIGEPYFAQANYWESVGSDAFSESLPDKDDWHFDPVRAGGGVMMDGVTHWVRPLRLWFGDIVEVVSTLGYPFRLSKRCETLAHAMLRFGSGKTAVLQGHYSDIPMYPLPFFQIFGNKGEITIDGSFDGGMSLRTRDNPKGQHLGSLGGYMAAFGPQMEAFLDAVVTSGKQNVMEDSPRQALQEVLVAKAVYKSAQTGKWESTGLDNLTGPTQPKY